MKSRIYEYTKETLSESRLPLFIICIAFIPVLFIFAIGIFFRKLPNFICKDIDTSPHDRSFILFFIMISIILGYLTVVITDNIYSLSFYIQYLLGIDADNIITIILFSLMYVLIMFAIIVTKPSDTKTNDNESKKFM